MDFFKKRNIKKVYAVKFNVVFKKYSEFIPETEIGFLKTNGITGNIADINKKEVIGMLEEIYGNSELLNQAMQKSARSNIVHKIYLLNNTEQGWSLRLHTFPLGGVTQNEEEKPHYHRWTLASKVLSGGYISTNYEVLSSENVDLNQRYYQYRFDKSENQIEQSKKNSRKY